MQLLSIKNVGETKNQPKDTRNWINYGSFPLHFIEFLYWNGINNSPWGAFLKRSKLHKQTRGFRSIAAIIKVPNSVIILLSASKALGGKSVNHVGVTHMTYFLLHKSFLRLIKQKNARKIKRLSLFDCCGKDFIESFNKVGEIDAWIIELY